MPRKGKIAGKREFYYRNISAIHLPEGQYIFTVLWFPNPLWMRQFDTDDFFRCLPERSKGSQATEH